MLGTQNFLNQLLKFTRKSLPQPPITSNDRPLACPIIHTNTNSQCYFGHGHLNNVWHGNGPSSMGTPCLTIIASNTQLVTECSTGKLAWRMNLKRKRKSEITLQNINNHKKTAFQSKANRPLTTYLGYIVNKFDYVLEGRAGVSSCGWGGGQIQGRRGGVWQASRILQVNKFEHVQGGHHVTCKWSMPSLVVVMWGLPSEHTEWQTDTTENITFLQQEPNLKSKQAIFCFLVATGD